MNISEFKAIVEHKTPRMIESKLVSLEEARAVLTNYDRLTEPFRTQFMDLPIGNVLEFASRVKKPVGRLKSYMEEVETKEAPEPEVEPLVEPVVAAQAEPIDDDPEPPESIPEPVMQVQTEAQPHPVQEAASISQVQQEFYTRLLERVDSIAHDDARPVTVTVETTDGHVERLFEIEQSMLTTLSAMSEKVEQTIVTSTDAQTKLNEVIDGHRTLLTHITESQRILAEQQRMLAQQQGEMVGAIHKLTETIGMLIQTPPNISPIVNVPAPIVNVTTESGRRMTTKRIERDDKGLISRITEDVDVDDSQG